MNQQHQSSLDPEMQRRAEAMYSRFPSVVFRASWNNVEIVWSTPSLTGTNMVQFDSRCVITQSFTNHTSEFGNA